jgi:hypothetical protein
MNHDDTFFNRREYSTSIYYYYYYYSDPTERVPMLRLCEATASKPVSPR